MFFPESDRTDSDRFRLHLYTLFSESNGGVAGMLTTADGDADDATSEPTKAKLFAGKLKSNGLDGVERSS